VVDDPVSGGAGGGIDVACGGAACWRIRGESGTAVEWYAVTKTQGSQAYILFVPGAPGEGYLHMRAAGVAQIAAGSSRAGSSGIDMRRKERGGEVFWLWQVILSLLGVDPLNGRSIW